MLISSNVNQSKREEYIAELMRYTSIDSDGKLYNNACMEEDRGWESKIDLYKQYKFVIAFENPVLTDYVTEKLYDPLLAGAVPIYMGTLNVKEYVPNPRCLIDANDFGSPKELAEHIEYCYENEQEYMQYHAWRNEPWTEDFIDKINVQEENPFIRLCRILDQKN